MPVATTDQLLQELWTKVKAIPSFTENSFTAFTFDGSIADSGRIPMPFCVITYEGCTPLTEGSTFHNTRGMTAVRSRAVVLEFSILVGHEDSVLGLSDNMSVLTGLLTSIHSSLSGFVGVNRRPWVFTGEFPVPFTPLEGTIWYGQGWETVRINTSNPLS